MKTVCGMIGGRPRGDYLQRLQILPDLYKVSTGLETLLHCTCSFLECLPERYKSIFGAKNGFQLLVRIDVPAGKETKQNKTEISKSKLVMCVVVSAAGLRGTFTARHRQPQPAARVGSTGRQHGSAAAAGSTEVSACLDKLSPGRSPARSAAGRQPPGIARSFLSAGRNTVNSINISDASGATGFTDARG